MEYFMQPIILLAIVGIAGGAMSVGFLGNTINLDVQQLGVGEATLLTPITQADIDFVIARASNSAEMHNVISECEIAADKDILAMSHIFCKLTDENGNVATEGYRSLTTVLPANTPTVIPIDDPTYIASQVQNIHDVILVVQGPSASAP